MIVFLFAFLVSALSCWLIIRSESLHQHLTADLDLDGVQKFHVVAVPRVGGLAILFGMLAAATWLSCCSRCCHISHGCCLWWLARLFRWHHGGYDQAVGVLPRLLLTMMSAVAGYWFLGAALTRLDVPYLDGVLSAWWPLSLLLTAVAVGGVANAINLVDGCNGLAGMVSAGIALCLGFVGYLLGDSFMTLSCLSLAGALLVLVWNFPFGRIFLGDGGAYFVGFLLAELSVLLVARHHMCRHGFPCCCCSIPSLRPCSLLCADCLRIVVLLVILMPVICTKCCTNVLCVGM